MGGRFTVSIPNDTLLTGEQLEAISEILRSTQRLHKKWVGSHVDPSGYVKELIPFDLETMTLQFLTESDYNAYRFLAANKPETDNK